jgi:hypothetical protein
MTTFPLNSEIKKRKGKSKKKMAGKECRRKEKMISKKQSIG